MNYIYNSRVNGVGRLQDYINKDIQKNKEANFLYLIVKNHVFADGNKRIVATLFIYFLNFYGILYKNGKHVIDNNTFTEYKNNFLNNYNKK